MHNLRRGKNGKDSLQDLHGIEIKIKKNYCGTLENSRLKRLYKRTGK